MKSKVLKKLPDKYGGRRLFSLTRRHSATDPNHGIIADCLAMTREEAREKFRNFTKVSPRDNIIECYAFPLIADKLMQMEGHIRLVKIDGKYP